MPVTIVNQALAARIRPDGQVIGDRIVMAQVGPTSNVPVERTIVGVVANTRSSGGHTRPGQEAFVPIAQSPRIALQIIEMTDEDRAVLSDYTRRIDAGRRDGGGEDD